MHPVAEIVEGRITLETPGDQVFTFETIKDLHTRALMVGIPTHATITRIAWHARADTNAPQQVSVYFIARPHDFVRYPEPLPMPAAPAPTPPEHAAPAGPPLHTPPFPPADATTPQGGQQFPDPITTQDPE